jgi:hypothetical protein
VLETDLSRMHRQLPLYRSIWYRLFGLACARIVFDDGPIYDRPDAREHERAGRVVGGEFLFIVITVFLPSFFVVCFLHLYIHRE